MMVIVGSEDGELEVVKRFAELIPVMAFVVMDGVEHNTGSAAPQFIESVTSFLESRQ